jgi:hypothetical protein
MNTDHPTVEIPFIMDMTYCKVVVYKMDEVFFRRFIELLGEVPGSSIESENEPNPERMEKGKRTIITPALLVALFSRATPEILRDALLSKIAEKK